MNPDDVIEAFVRDVMRKVPAKDRNDIGLELRGLLADMLADRAQREGRAADDAMSWRCCATSGHRPRWPRATGRRAW